MRRRPSAGGSVGGRSSQIDRRRADAYAAEEAAFSATSYDSPHTMPELRRTADAICSAQWWTAGPVDMRAARRDAQSSSTRWCDHSPTPVVRLAHPQATPVTLWHELAHALAGHEAGHGPVFRRALLDVVRAAAGSREAGWLADQYVRFDLPIGARAWPEPAPADGPIAL